MGAKELLEANKDILENMKDALLKYETIDADQIDDLMNRREVRAPSLKVEKSNDDSSSNGDNKDNRLENLRYVCPNCHAMTVTYRGRNKKLKNLMDRWESDGGDAVGFFCLEKTAMLLEKWR